MAIKFTDRLKGRWQAFHYNFGWSSYAWLFENRVAKATILVPVIGYLVLFNDDIAGLIKFEHLARESTISFGLSSRSRIRLLYLGLLLISLAQILYYCFRPRVLRFSSDVRGYVDYGLSYFTFSDFMNLHDEIRFKSSGPVSGYGDYYDQDWEDFKATALPDSEFFGKKPSKKANWLSAKTEHEDLLKSILKETFAMRDRNGRFVLVVAMVLVGVGYILLLIPSVDLTVKVISTIWSDLAKPG